MQRKERNSLRRAAAELTVFGFCLLLAGCRPKIGDDCDTSADCSSNGDRLCDPTQPGGYCTIFNCEPGGCPEEAVCVAFHVAISSASACVDPQGESRLRRTFCVAKCERAKDCRSGYVCADLGNANNPWSAAVVEHSGSRVCLVAPTGSPIAEDAQAGVCTGTDASFDVPAAGGAAGAGPVAPGAAGAGGAAGGSGALSSAGTGG
ncbi:MAG TPA: hypothetical protein VGJ84_16630 [Polyangiaceae bacterium]